MKTILLKESELIKLISRVINEEETDPIKDDHPTEPIVTFPLCCLWFCSECGFIWGGGQWNPPPGTTGTAGKYVNVAPNISNKNNINLKAKPSSGGNFRMGESDLKRIVKRVINERNANRGIVGENWKDTSWEDDDGKITIGDITDYIGNDIRNISVSDLENKLGDQVSSVTQGEERIMKADLQYPIILVQKDGEFSYVLDGNHRLAKAIMTGEEYIKAKVLYLDDKNTPEDFKRLLGRE